jgi:ribosomal-protein-serine acetyltransferase
MPWTEGTRSVEDQRVWLESVTTDPDGLEGVGIFVEGRYAGNAGISRHDAFGIAAEIGYWIDGAYEGRGIVTKAVRTMVDICFRDLEVHRVVIRAALENARSRAIPERLGFTLEGVLRGEGKGSGPYGFHDLAVYGLLEEEWTTM